MNTGEEILTKSRAHSLRIAFERSGDCLRPWKARTALDHRPSRIRFRRVSPQARSTIATPAKPRPFGTLIAINHARAPSNRLRGDRTREKAGINN